MRAYNDKICHQMMIRWICGVTLQDSKTSEELRQRLGTVIVSVCDGVHQGRLRWFTHVEWKDECDWVSVCRDIAVAGERGRGRGKQTWEECTADDMRKTNLRKEDARDRGLRRSGIFGNRPTCANAEARTLKR